MPHHGVVRKDRETSKLRIVFDGSAKQNVDEFSLIEPLDEGPNYIPSLFDVLVKFRVHQHSQQMWKRRSCKSRSNLTIVTCNDSCGLMM